MSDALTDLQDKIKVQELVTRLFISTDRRDWDGVKRCFAPTVRFDMSSAGGGSPTTLTPSQIADAWEQGLGPIEHVHHQSGNFVVDVRGGEASAFCYGIALHHKKTASERDTRAFVGSYDFALRRSSDGGGAAPWVIESFRFNLAFTAGNLELEKG